MRITPNPSVTEAHDSIESEIEEALRIWRISLRSDFSLKDTQTKLVKASMLVREYRKMVSREGGAK